MKKALTDFFVSPISRERLVLSKKKLVTESRTECYDIIKNVPMLLPEEFMADWHRELIEVILWEYREEIEKMYSEIDWKKSPVPIYIKYIKKLLHDKQGITDAFERYSKQNTDKWIVQNSSNVITLSQKLKFNRYARKSNGKSRTSSKINASGIFKVYPYFSETVNESLPETIVELGTGAGGGTAAIALKMKENARLYTVDIGFECLGNAIGIAKYQKKSIIPVCANFWYLPFADGSVDAVCTYNGLDESRETERTVVEVARILKDGGIFTVTSRKNAFMRQSSVLEPFGFTREETVEIMKKCRLYSDIDTLTEICRNHGLILNSQKEFKRNEELTFVVSEFEKKNM